MKNARSFLTACWQNLIVLTYAVPPAVLEPFLPPHCQADCIGDDAFASLVAFDFAQTRVHGVAWPGHVNFPEVNLRYYLRCGQRHGVAFIREMVPRRLVATVARWFYNESFRTVAMQSWVDRGQETLAVEHQLRLDGSRYRIRVVADLATRMPGDDEPEHYFKEQRWGFGTSRFGGLLAYRVEHPPWLVHGVRGVELDWDWRAIYGPHWAFLQDRQPCSAMLMAGSAVTVSPKFRPDWVESAGGRAVGGRRRLWGISSLPSGD